MQLKVTF